MESGRAVVLIVSGREIEGACAATLVKTETEF